MSNRKDSFLDKYYYAIMMEGKRRLLAEQQGKKYSPMTSWELAEVVFQDIGWDDIYGFDDIDTDEEDISR